MKFASSPSFFNCESNNENTALLKEIQMNQFPMVGRLVNYGLLTCMCLASMLHHWEWICTLNVNHVIRNVSTVFCSSETLQMLKQSVQVTYPWNDEQHTFCGIPPHVALLQQLTMVKESQQELKDAFISKVKQALEDYGVNGGHMTERQLRHILEEFQQDLTVSLRRDFPQNRIDTSDNALDGEDTYRLHIYGGRMHRVPSDWRFPRCGVFDLWHQWWIGDSI